MIYREFVSEEFLLKLRQRKEKKNKIESVDKPTQLTYNKKEEKKTEENKSITLNIIRF